MQDGKRNQVRVQASEPRVEKVSRGAHIHESAAALPAVRAVRTGATARRDTTR